MSTIHLVVCHFAEITPAEESRLLALLMAADEEGIARHPVLRRNQQLARAWRRELLAQALNVKPDLLIFEKEAHGKPFLANHNISFNISHSKEAFAMVWSLDAIPLGIDIEDKIKNRKEQTLAARTFDAAEMKAWQNPELSPIQAHEQWLKTWTRKEAVLKAHGLGIRLDLNTLSTENTDDTLTHVLLGEWQYRSFVLDEQVVSLAWRGEKVVEINL
ncbi:MAG: 4'-phosphopantetheinyl transferase superfamily protein [Candidatus Saccharibacteria bacterium]|nr:4'-phosphopantetheinyl transferase superfamily protein [Moraxellaceae bacterium]